MKQRIPVGTRVRTVSGQEWTVAEHRPRGAAYLLRNDAGAVTTATLAGVTAVEQAEEPAPQYVLFANKVWSYTTQDGHLYLTRVDGEGSTVLPEITLWEESLPTASAAWVLESEVIPEEALEEAEESPCHCGGTIVPSTDSHPALSPSESLCEDCGLVFGDESDEKPSYFVSAIKSLVRF
jgi:hypothetical protein